MTDVKRDAWHALDIARAASLVDARLQLHHAAQLASAMGISYLGKRPDDSHTNLQWLTELDALASNRVGSMRVRLAVRPDPLALLLLDAGGGVGAELSLHGRTLDEAAAWVREHVAEYGLAPEKYTLSRHYAIPPHEVERGQPFDASDRAAFTELSRWFANATTVISELGLRVDNPSPVRCWPHHFDIAMIFAPGAEQAIGVGLEPGDSSYAEPYWYANSYPTPSSATDAPLEGGGIWHTEEWTGAVLPATRMTETDQRAQVERFVESALRAYGTPAA